MALPDSGNVEDYTEAEMNELLQKFETDKNQLSKLQKAAVARYNFKKGKGDAINFKGSGPAAAVTAPSPAETAGKPPNADITSMLPPDIQILANKDPATLTKDEKIALAKAKSQAVRAQAAAGKPLDEPAKPKGPSPEEIAAKKALEFVHAKHLQERFGDAIVGWSMMTNMPYANVRADRLLDVVRYLHMEMGYDQLRNLTAADYPPERLEVVYNLYRHAGRESIALKVQLPRHAAATPENPNPSPADYMPSLPSIVSIYQGADWLEREVFDLLGIRFLGHPYMRRLFMPDTWVGHPLRKDYDLKKEQFIGLDERGNDIVSFRSEDGW